MSTITLTPEMAKLFCEVKAPTEVRDPHGQVLGVFAPQPAPQSPWTEADLIEAERILERERDQGIPTAEVLRRLKALEKSS